MSTPQVVIEEPSLVHVIYRNRGGHANKKRRVWGGADDPEVEPKVGRRHAEKIEYEPTSYQERLNESTSRYFVFTSDWFWKAPSESHLVQPFLAQASRLMARAPNHTR